MNGNLVGPQEIVQTWLRRPCREEAVVGLIRTLGISPWLARILAGRGIEDPRQAREMIQPELCPCHNPASLPGIDAFLQRIEKAIRSHDRIIIHGDYDADGVTSSALMLYALQRIGLDCEVYLPNRFESGYGIHPDWVEQQKASGFRLIITTDCGSTATPACLKAREIGIDIIITDHHTPDPDLPGTAAHVNPHLPDSRYPFKDLCGAGVALKLAQALTGLVPPSFQQTYRQEMPVELAMIGTLADVMPLVGENRRIVIDGLDRARAQPSPGLQALFGKARLQAATLNAEAITFQVAPRLNAAGRLQSPQIAFELLIEKDPVRAQQLAAQLESANDQRKKIASQAAESAFERLRAQPREGAVILADSEWHRGVLGLVAAKILEASGQPVFLGAIEGDLVHGSARVPPGFHAARILEHVSELTERAGGHSAAAGFTVQLARWEEFSQAVSDLILKHPGDIEGVEVYLDAFFESNEDLPKVLEEIAHLDPYGQGFPVPSFSICRFQEKQRTQVFGDNHLRINLGSAREPLEAVGFSLGEWAEEIEKHPVDIAIEYAENTWNGKTSLRPKILAIRPSLRETTEPAGAGEVARLETEGPLSKVVVWDARGLCPLENEHFLRIGYGPDWRDWWEQVVPGKYPFWKNKAWERYTALPPGSWPGACSTGYAGEIPSDWDGEVVEILWPPLRKSDGAWLQSILPDNGSEVLLRLAFNPGLLEEWFQACEAEIGRESIAQVYRSISHATPLKDLLALPLKPMMVGLSIEILADLDLITVDGDILRKAANPPRRELTESALLEKWRQFYRMLQAWLDQSRNRPALELVRRWLKNG